MRESSESDAGYGVVSFSSMARGGNEEDEVYETDAHNLFVEIGGTDYWIWDEVR